jgi:integrase/recombinase XerD
VDPRFEQFIKERRYLANVSPRTLEWYEQSLHWLSNPGPMRPR